MKKKWFSIAAVALLGIGLLAACGGSGDKKKDTGSSSSESSSEAKTEKLTVKDSEGNDVEVKANPEKVVVFDMGSLDTIDAIGKGSTVVGAPVKSLPAYLADAYGKVESAGEIKGPDLEAINKMQPDLIIISGRQADSKDDLSKIAPVLYLSVNGEDTWGSIKTNVETLGKIFGAEKEAAEKLTALETKIADTKAKAEKANPKTLVVLVNEGKLSAYGAGSRFGIVHDTFGFPMADDKIEASTHGQEVSYEYVLEKDPDVIFVVDRTKAIGGDDSKNDVAANELVKKTKAGKNNKVITLTADVWYLAGGGLESTDLMIDDVNKAFE